MDVWLSSEAGTLQNTQNTPRTLVSARLPVQFKRGVQWHSMHMYFGFRVLGSGCFHGCFQVFTLWALYGPQQGPAFQEVSTRFQSGYEALRPPSIQGRLGLNIFTKRSCIIIYHNDPQSSGIWPRDLSTSPGSLQGFT